MGRSKASSATVAAAAQLGPKWPWPNWQYEFAGTPAARSFATYASPSARSGSSSPTTTNAGGSPWKLSAWSGEAKGAAPSFGSFR
jgi:hypothetical protein